MNATIGGSHRYRRVKTNGGSAPGRGGAPPSETAYLEAQSAGLVLQHSAQHCPALPCPALLYHPLHCPVLPGPALPFLALFLLTLPSNALSGFFLACHTLHCSTVSFKQMSAFSKGFSQCALTEQLYAFLPAPPEGQGAGLYLTPSAFLHVCPSFFAGWWPQAGSPHGVVVILFFLLVPGRPEAACSARSSPGEFSP
jgi:hypothetical protein